VSASARTVALLLTCLALAAGACSAPARFRDVPLGATADEVRARLGEPRARTPGRKLAPTGPSFGPRASDAYLALPDGTPIETWRYRHFRETWSYTFSLAGEEPVLVDQGYHHPDIVY